MIWGVESVFFFLSAAEKERWMLSSNFIVV